MYSFSNEAQCATSVEARSVFFVFSFLYLFASILGLPPLASFSGVSIFQIANGSSIFSELHIREDF